MSKRVVILSDEELELLMSWAEVARDGVLHDWLEDDDELAEKLQAFQVKA